MVALTSFGQITTSTLSGVVKNSKGEILVGATVHAVHQPTGSEYKSQTNKLGVYAIPAVRPGGPYLVHVSYVGFKMKEVSDVNTSLGLTTNVDVVLEEESLTLKEVTVSAGRNNTFSKDRTGASQVFGRRELQSIPITGARTINGITKYNPLGDGSSFGAVDSRLNNFTIDGSQFNNGFGLGSSAQAGGRTGSSAISLDAIDQLQVNIAPFDIRQSGFVGAGINAVTRSGTNKLEGSYYQTQRDNSSRYVGDKAYGVPVTAAKFDEVVRGFRLGSPIIKNKLFIFGNYEFLEKTEPGTTWTSAGSPLGGSQVTRVQYNDMKTLSDFMATKFGYQTGPWEGYSNTNASKKFLVRVDWNINDKHKLTARYVHHNSNAEINISNSQSAGAGNRTTIFNSMSFQNSGYIIMDNTRSGVLELNSKFSNTLHNNLIVGYDKQIEDRAYMSPLFPTIDIADGTLMSDPTKIGPNYISLGFDPFTPGNKLNYGTFHITNNLTKYLGKHTVTTGLNFENYKSNNLFYPASNGVYMFKSLADFYTAANQSLSSNGAPSTLLPYRFQMRYSALPNGEEPLQVLKTNRLDLYLQDEYQVGQNLKLTAGFRTAIIDFENTAIDNPEVASMTFINGDKFSIDKFVKFNTGLMPKTQILLEPRFGFNWDVNGKKTTQFRGGTGIFTGRPPYVFVSNQVGNNGVLTGFLEGNTFGFTTNPTKYFSPAIPQAPQFFDLAFTDPNYKFPQVWKTNLAVDKKLPLGFVISAEYLLNKNLNAVHYYNANLESPVGRFSGYDRRLKFAGTSNNSSGLRVNDNVSMAAVLTNNSDGFYNAISFKLEKPISKGFFGSIAYTKSNAKDFMSAGSIASGTWQSIRSINGNNNPLLSNSDFLVPQRTVGLLGYRIEYGKKYGGATSITLGYVGQESNGYSYFIAGDMNSDGVSNNDLIFVPNKASDIKFTNILKQDLNPSLRNTPAGLDVVYTVAQQQDAFEAYIAQDEYLNSRRGDYAERNGAFLPWLHRFDLSIVQDLFVNVKGQKNTVQFRFDILNFGNMVNDKWGVSQRVTNPAILTYASVVNNEPVYRLSTQKFTDGTTGLIRDTYSRNSSVFDVWTAQFGLRYIFGR